MVNPYVTKKKVCKIENYLAKGQQDSIKIYASTKVGKGPHFPMTCHKHESYFDPVDYFQCCTRSLD